jgi:hypothetical protein
VKILVLCNPDPGGIAIPPSQLILEAKHLRSDSSRTGDLYAIAGDLHATFSAMDVVLTSTISNSCLLESSTSSDFALRQAEGNKFRKNLKSREPLQLPATQRFIPLAMNQCGRRGPHFDAILRSMASLTIWRLAGCCQLQVPFALPLTVALANILSAWGARLAGTAQREHAAQIVRAVKVHKGGSAFMSSAAIHNTLPQYSADVHSTLPQYCAAVCSTVGASGQGFDMDGFNRAGEMIGLGPAG